MGKDRTEGREDPAEHGMVAVPDVRRIRLEAVLDRAHQDLMGVALGSGLQILAAMLEEGRNEICGSKRKQCLEQQAYRYGSNEGPVVMGGRRVRVKKPRVGSLDGREIELPTWAWATREDPLDERATQQMLARVSTRGYAKSLEAPPPGVEESLCVSRSSVSRRFVARAQVEGFLGRPLAELDVRVVMIDGTWLGDYLLLVALGIDATGCKHVLGVREGSTENEGVCRSLLSEFVDRGLVVERGRLFVIVVGKGIRKAIRGVFGAWALVQRWQVHKLRNVLEHLPEGQQGSVRTALRRAWASPGKATATRRLHPLARQLESRWPSAAASLREGLDETLTILALEAGAALYRTLRATNPIENLQSLSKRVARRVTRWRDGSMALRWAVTGLMDAKSVSGGSAGTATWAPSSPPSKPSAAPRGRADRMVAWGC